MKQALHILIDYLTCTDPIIQNKWLNLLSSFWHKDAGWLLKSITKEAGGYKITVVDSDGNNADHTISIPTMPNSQPISYIQGLEAALENKVAIASGKGLSANDFTTKLKQKLEGLNNYVHPELHEISDIKNLSSILDEKINKSSFSLGIESLENTLFEYIKTIGTIIPEEYLKSTDVTKAAKKGLSIKDKNGIPQIKATNFLEIDGVSFNSSKKRITVSPLTPNTVFIHSGIGNDLTGQLNDYSKPFKTDTGAYNALPNDDGRIWDFVFVNPTGTEDINQLPTRLIRYKCDYVKTFNLSNITGYKFFKMIHFDIPQCTLYHNSTSSTNFYGEIGLNFIKCRKLDVRTNVFHNHLSFFHGKGIYEIAETIYHRGNLALLNGYVKAETLDTSSTRFCSTDTIINIKNLKLNGNTFSFSNTQKQREFPFYNITGVGTLICDDFSGIFNLDKMSAEIGVNLEIRYLGVVTGDSKKVLGKIKPTNHGGWTFRNFKGRIEKMTNTAGYPFNESTFENCDVYLADKLHEAIRPQTQTSHRINITNTEFIQDNPDVLIGSIGLGGTLEFYITGYLKTSHNSLGDTNVTTTHKTRNTF